MSHESGIDGGVNVWVRLFGLLAFFDFRLGFVCLAGNPMSDKLEEEEEEQEEQELCLRSNPDAARVN